MKKQITISIFAIAGVLLLAGVSMIYLNPQDESIAQESPSNSDNPQEYSEQTNQEGPVSVTVQPSYLDGWNFEITLSTHSVELTEDMTSATSLFDDLGNEFSPLNWQGDPPGGHHRSGILRFGDQIKDSTRLSLVVTNVGGIDMREFSWDL